ncbi:MAG: LysM peptidoglycan-binding domain-containing protein [Rhodobacteraceae bacterium]|nr:LysM peptidoglycan-binding domain-containing protein [Paracoccaceae bacterium]
MTPTDRQFRLPARALALGLGLSLLAGCQTGWDYDFRNMGKSGRDSALQVQSAPRPTPDARGVISYPTYQVAVARRGDTVADIAARVGLPTTELARYNGIPEGAALHSGEIIALPRRVAETDGPISATTLSPGGEIDIATLAGGAIERAGPGTQRSPVPPQDGEPVRHKVERGETAYSIARLYNVTVRALADWNGLGPDLAVREGQYLLIPLPAARSAAAAPVPVQTEKPGAGSRVSTPPSAAKPLPREEATAKAAPPASPQMGAQKSSGARFAMPAEGSIIRGYQKGKNDGIDIAAGAGSTVRAVEGGTVAAITRDTDQVPILVVRHADNMLSVYANIDAIAVKKGDTVSRGQAVAKVRAGDPAFLHFELRKGFESVDPLPYLTP